MSSKQQKSSLATVGLIYAAAIWGSTFVVVKQALDHIDPIILVGYRFAIAALLLGAVLLVQKRKLLTNLRPGIVLGVLIWVLYVAQTVGLKYTTATNSAFITGLFVACLPILGLLLFRQIPGKRKVIAVLLSLAGLWFLTGGLQGINSGDLMTLITAVAYAAHILYADRYVRGGHDPYVLSFQQFLVVGALSLAAGALMGKPFSAATAGTVWVILFLALFPTLSAFLIQLLAQRNTSAIKVSLIFALEPVFAAAFAWTVGGEEFLIRRAVGGLLVFAAMIISESRKPTADLAPESETLHP